MHDDNQYWIGFSDQKEEGNFIWDDASPVNFEFWNKKEPNDKRKNEDCVVMKRSKKWNDLDCSKERNYICEYPGGLQTPEEL